jgi:D-alanyl-D-alanine carboxypeptidase
MVIVPELLCILFSFNMLCWFWLQISRSNILFNSRKTLDLMPQKTLFCLILLLSVVSSPSYAVRYASIIVEERTGTVLHAANPDRRVPPASLAKMMTLYLAFEALRNNRLTLDTQMTVSKHASRRPKSRLGLRKVKTISVRDVIAALITKSANDAATVLAEHMGGTETRFAQIMTARARQLGMIRTTFTNASGLPDRRQTSTARDIVKLAIALRRDFPERFKLFAMKSFKYKGRVYRNHNKLLSQYKGTDGIKTGYVRDSGYNIVVSVERKGRRVIAAVFGGKSPRSRDRHIKVLLRRTFSMLAENDRLDSAKSKTMAQKNIPVRQKSGSISLARIAPAGPNEEDDLNDDSWSVQIGVFNRFAPAHLAAGRASRLVPALRGTRVVVEASSSPKERIFQSRLSGLNEKRANDACRALRKKKMSCLVIREENSTAQGDR